MKRLATAALAVFLMLTGALPSLGEESRSIRLSFAGDCTLGGHEGWMDYSIGTFKVMAQEQQDYSYFLRFSQNIFAGDDFTFVNLEGVLADSAKGQNKNLKWNFRGATEYADILTLGSVEGVTLGNNHSGDYGKTGLQSTQETLDKAGIEWCLDRKACFYEKDGVKIAFLGFWSASFADNREWLKTEIPRLKKEEGCSAVVVNYHGGRQYWQKHRDSQTQDMRYAIDHGADLVIGHHPHVLQGMEIYKERLIVYSLGNFCYGGNRKPRGVEYPTMILGAEMFFEGGMFSGVQLTVHPYRISGTAPRNNYQPLPVTGDLALEVMDILQADTPFPLEPYIEGKGAEQLPVLVTGK